MVEEEKTGRLFYAVQLSETAHRELCVHQNRLREVGARVRWVPPEQLHCTLVFAGAVPVSVMPALMEGLEEAGAETAPFELVCDTLGAFGSPKSPRVIWAGVADPSGGLALLQQRLSARVRECGLAVDERPFHAHVTLGRVKGRRRLDALTTALSFASVTDHVSSRVEQVHLVESRLQPDGARHVVLHSAALKGET